MPRCLELVAHLEPDVLEARYRAAHDPVERTHWHIIWLVAHGHHCPTVATMVGYSEDWVRTIVHRYNAAGSAGIVDRRHANPGATPLLTAEDREALRVALASPSPDGGLWTSPKVASWMGDRLGRPVRSQRGWEALRALGFTPQRPRPRATGADPDAQVAFKKGAPNSGRRGKDRASGRHGERLG